jgi:hypothetical protein
MGGDVDLARETLRADGHGEVGVKDFEGDGAAMLQVLGKENRRHSTVSELPLDGISPDQGGLQPFEDIEQGRFACKSAKQLYVSR